MTTPFLIADLKRDEGLNLQAYPDPLTDAEPWTIGWGHTGPNIHPGLVWTEAQCEEQLEADVASACRALDGSIPWWRTLDDVRQDVLANMAFNLGVRRLMLFQQTLKAVQAGKYDVASRAMLASAWAGQVGDRARRLSEQMKTGTHA